MDLDKRSVYILAIGQRGWWGGHLEKAGHACDAGTQADSRAQASPPEDRVVTAVRAVVGWWWIRVHA